MPDTTRDVQYDLILLGASGFTGRLACEYLADHYADSGLRWAMAGRNLEKLEEVRAQLGSPGGMVSRTWVLRLRGGAEAAHRQQPASSRPLAGRLPLLAGSCR